MNAAWLLLATLGVITQPSPSNTVVVSRETEPRRFSEPYLVVHPAKPNHLLAAVWTGLTAEAEQQERRCSSFVSVDTGKTWTRHDFALNDCYDAQVAITPDGHAVFVALAIVPNIRPNRADWLVVFNSTDGGLTWQDTPTVLGYRHDHPAVVADLSSSPRRGWIYITSHLEWPDGNPVRKSAVIVTRSRDSGQTFDIPVFVSPNAEHNSSEMPVVLSDGTLVVSYQEYKWEGVTPRRKLWTMRSTDGGVTFGTPSLVNEECGPPPGFQLTALAVDLSTGPFRDRLYAACRRDAGGGIVLSTSRDRGQTWTGPSVPVGPSASAPNARRVVSMAVNATGIVGTMIAERRNDASDACHNVTLSLSRDGGKTFAAPRMVSSARCGDSPNDQRASRRFPTYGDYFGIAAAPDGRFHLMWPEMRDGASVLLTTLVSPEP